MFKLSPSILSADFANLERDCARAGDAGADMLHVDVMDGHFVPNISIGAPVVAALRRVTDMTLDVHLMIEAPGRYLDDFLKAGADIVTVHLEVHEDVPALLSRIRAAGRRASVCIKPGTPAEDVLPLLPLLDMVLVMSVEPGFGGQKFMPMALPKVALLRRAIDEGGFSCDIEIDGGIGPANIAEVVAAGTNVVVAGSSVFGAPDIAEAVRTLRRLGGA